MALRYACHLAALHDGLPAALQCCPLALSTCIGVCMPPQMLSMFLYQVLSMLDGGPYYFPCCLAVLCTCIGVTRPPLLLGRFYMSPLQCPAAASVLKGHPPCNLACRLGLPAIVLQHCASAAVCDGHGCCSACQLWQKLSDVLLHVAVHCRCVWMCRPRLHPATQRGCVPSVRAETSKALMRPGNHAVLLHPISCVPACASR